MGIVNQRLDFSVEVTTGIDNIQTGDTALDGECGEVKLVYILLWLKFG